VILVRVLVPEPAQAQVPGRVQVLEQARVRAQARVLEPVGAAGLSLLLRRILSPI
jgi:hypothetical protein